MGKKDQDFLYYCKLKCPEKEKQMKML